MSADTTPTISEQPTGPHWLAATGTRAWWIVGILAVVTAGSYVLARGASVFVPFLLAVILGVLFAPVVDALERLRLPRPAGAGIVMLLIVAVVGVIGWLIIGSVGTQVGVVDEQLNAALSTIQKSLTSLHLSQATVDSLITDIKTQLPKYGASMANVLFSGLSSLAGVAFGAFISMYMLFFTLSDAGKLATWLGRHMGLPETTGAAIVADCGHSIRQYFRGTGILAIVTSAATGLGLLLAGVPLVAPIMLVTFVMVFIPYVGAVVASAFAVLIALGAGGMKMAGLALLVVILVQNGLQGAVAGYVLGDALDLHPIVVIMATMLGGIFGGIFGAMLGAPIAAIVVRSVGHLREANQEV